MAKVKIKTNHMSRERWLRIRGPRPLSHIVLPVDSHGQYRHAKALGKRQKRKLSKLDG
jgi:hypothetical protein